jgi:hypothetical protein
VIRVELLLLSRLLSLYCCRRHFPPPQLAHRVCPSLLIANFLSVMDFPAYFVEAAQSRQN